MTPVESPDLLAQVVDLPPAAAVSQQWRFPEEKRVCVDSASLRMITSGLPHPIAARIFCDGQLASYEAPSLRKQWPDSSALTRTWRQKRSLRHGLRAAEAVCWDSV